MKTTIEVGGFEIKIEEMEGNISVSAMKEGEVVEEFELASEDFESQDMGDESDDMESFGDEGMEEEEDFEGEGEEEFGEEDDMDDEEFGDEEEEEEGEGKLESFSRFVRTRRK